MSGYTIVSDDFIRTHLRDLTGNEYMVMTVIEMHADGGGRCFPSQKRMAELTGLSTATIKRSVAGLQDKGFIEIQRERSDEGKKTNNKYHAKIRFRQGMNNPQVNLSPGEETIAQIEPKPGLKISKTRAQIDPLTRPNEPYPINQKGEKDRKGLNNGSTPPPQLSDDYHSFDGPATPTPTSVKVSRYGKVTRDWLDGRRLVNSRIPRGKGKTPVEVYLEVYAFDPKRLSEYNAERMTEVVGTDEESLERWRETVRAWGDTPYKSDNYQGMFDWYRNGVPQRGNDGHKQSDKKYAKQPRPQHQRNGQRPYLAEPTGPF
jgi:hypothetical protein